MGSGGGTRTFAGTCLAGEDQDLEHLEKRRLQQMIMMMVVENLPIFAEKRQYIRGLAAELRGARDWMKVATAGDEGIRLYTWQHQGQRPGDCWKIQKFFTPEAGQKGCTATSKG